MEVFKISGPTVFGGKVKIQGSKNAVLPMMAAAVVGSSNVTLKNCPDISDVHSAIEILNYIGCKAQLDKGVLTIDASGEITNYIPGDIMCKTRASFIFTGALLARCKSFRVSHPGGCNIGQRPVDIHLESFRKLGAKVETTSKDICCSVESFNPCDLYLRFPSVGATENIMILASSIKGRTRIHNSAREPEIADLQKMLNKMGAHITGAGTGVITIEGTLDFKDATYAVMPDRIDCATYLSALACCKGSLTLLDTDRASVQSYVNILKKCGMEIDVFSNRIEAQKTKRLKGGITVNTGPYPAFATDIQSLFMSVMALSDGVSLIRENVFENRFSLARSLQNMGADIRVYKKTASVRGVRSLVPQKEKMPDLRSGAALCLAMMSCEGTSVASDICYLERGYENFCEKYKSIGADIERIELVEN